MINRDPNRWSNPNEFNPLRFTKDNNWKFHRFGIGPRKCLGNMFADYILKVGIISIISEFKIFYLMS